MHLYAIFVFIGATANCIGMVQDNFLLVTDSTGSLFQIDLSTEFAWRIPLSPQRNPIAVAYDPMDSKVYWTDVVEKCIKRANLDGTTEEVVEVLHRISIPDGMAIDIASRLVYYTDKGLDIIGVMTLDGSQHFTLLTEDMTEPRAIVLHPAMGLMYWTDWGSAPKIEVAAMDGTQRRILLNLKSQSWPNGLALDTVGKRLYWCDGYYGTIESVALDGSSRTILTTILGAHFYGIIVVAPNVFFTEWNSKNVSTFVVSDPYPIPERVGPNIFGRPNGLTFYNRTHYEHDRHMNSSCSNQNGGCEHICLATPNGPRCACPDGLNFINGTECSLRTYTCPQVYTATKWQIRSPGYPGYKNNLHCSIVIRKSNPNKVQRRITLYVEDFDLQEKYDYLLIGTNKFTGTQLTRYHTYTVSTSAAEIVMSFVSDRSIVGRGFIFVYAIYDVVNCNSNSRCHNGGTCINGEYCLCRDAFEGDWCDHATDHCASNPCQNGGTCVHKSEAFECKCLGYYRGSLCEYANLCKAMPCQNGALCSELDGVKNCKCVDGFKGKNCEHMLPTNTPQPPSTKDMTVVTIGIIVGSLLGLGLGLGLVFGGMVYCVRKKNRTRETQREEEDDTNHNYASLQFHNRAYNCRDHT